MHKKYYEQPKCVLRYSAADDVITASANAQLDCFSDGQPQGWEGEEW